MILDLYDFLDKFIQDGGALMYPLMIVNLFLWTFLVERLFYLFKKYPAEAESLIEFWNKSTFKNHWIKSKLRKTHLVEMQAKLQKNISSIKLLVNLAPMIGLLGTVGGMIAIFDVMSAMGTSNARLMAAGISTATITTMVGLVVSLSGFYLGIYVDERAKRELELLEDHLQIDHSGELTV